MVVSIDGLCEKDILLDSDQQRQKYGFSPNQRWLPVPSERTPNTHGSPGLSMSRGTVR